MSKVTSKKILIVDDEEGIRESLKLILGDFYELILAESGSQAMDILKNAKDIGLILMDIKMPKVHGLEMIPQIQKLYKSIPIIMVTGYRSVETAQEAISRGAVDYIVKPFKSEDILESVRKRLK